MRYCQQVDSAQNEWFWPGAAQIRDCVEELLSVTSVCETHSHVGATNKGIGNLRVERSDANKLDGAAVSFRSLLGDSLGQTRHECRSDNKRKVAARDFTRRERPNDRSGNSRHDKTCPERTNPYAEDSGGSCGASVRCAQRVSALIC